MLNRKSYTLTRGKKAGLYSATVLGLSVLSIGVQHHASADSKSDYNLVTDTNQGTVLKEETTTPTDINDIVGNDFVETPPDNSNGVSAPTTSEVVTPEVVKKEENTTPEVAKPEEVKKEDTVKVDTPSAKTEEVKKEDTSTKQEDTVKVDTPSAKTEEVKREVTDSTNQEVLTSTRNKKEQSTSLTDDGVLTKKTDETPNVVTPTIEDVKVPEDTQTKNPLNIDKNSAATLSDIDKLDKNNYIKLAKGEVSSPEYSDTQDLYANDVNTILKPQDYLVVYDYYGMDDARKAKGWDILKGTAQVVADGSRFMVQMTKSQLANHANISEGQTTTGLLSKEEILAMSSPQDLIAKGITGSGTFYEKYQNELRGNSDHDISALYIFDNWTLSNPSNPNSEKENYDLGFINYLKSNNAKTIMAVGLFDKDGSAEKLVVEQSQAIGFNNYFISSNPDMGSLTKQFLETSKAYTTGSRDYTVTVTSQNGVKITNGTYTVDGKEVALGVSPDGLSATANFSYNGKDVPKGTLKYNVTPNSSQNDVTVSAKVTTSGKDAIKYKDQVIGHTSVGSIILSLRQGDKELKNVSIADSLPYGSTYDFNSVVPKLVSYEGKYYKLKNVSNASGTIDSSSTTVNVEYEPVQSTLTVEFLDANGNKLQNDHSEVFTNGYSYDLPKTIEKDGISYHLVGDGVSNQFGSTLTGDISNGNTDYKIHYVNDLGTVVIDFIDEDTMKPISTTKIIAEKVPVGSKVSTDDSTIPTTITTPSGKVYRILSSKDDLLANTNISKGVKQLKAVYKENKAKFSLDLLSKDNVSLHHFEDNSVSYGTDWSANPVLKDKIVTSDGKVYKLVSTGEAMGTQGTVKDGDVHLKYYYTEVVSDLSLNFVNEKGESIKPSIVEKGLSVGTSYDLSEKREKRIKTDKHLYELTDEGSNLSLGGITQEQSTSLTLKYRELFSKVSLNFVDKNGNPLKSGLSLNDMSIGGDFDLSKEVVNTLNNRFGRYRITSDSSKKSVKGTVTEEPIDITLTYEPVMTKGKLVFIDEKGNTVTSPILVDDVQVDGHYDFNNYAINSIVTADGREFDLVMLSSNVAGIAPEDEFTVQFIYRERVKPVSTPESEPVQQASYTIPSPKVVQPEGKVLPNTGDTDTSKGAAVIGVMSSLAGLGLLGLKSRKSED